MMQWNLPGTVLTIPREDAALVRQQFAAMFFGGGVTLSQVTSITGLEPYTVQNWVKRGFLPSPEQKRYNLNQLCRIIMISMLKRTLPMEQICGMLSFINGHLDKTADDLIDDSQLYFMFVELAASFSDRRGELSHRDAIDSALESYAEPIPGARQRVRKVLGIMLTAWAAAQLHETATKMAAQLQTEP